MRSEIIYCPHLDRDVRGLLARVPNPRIRTGYKTVRGEDGCLESHKAIIRDAQRDGQPYVFVMEDDCAFTPAFDYQLWCGYAEWALQNGFDAVVGGCVLTYDQSIAFRNRPGAVGLEAMIYVPKFHSAQCIIYLASGYEKALTAEQPWDVDLGQKGVKTVLTYPFVAVQRPVYSGILSKDVDYRNYFQMHQDHLGQMFGLTQVTTGV
jgi:hypothetical protein